MTGRERLHVIIIKIIKSMGRKTFFFTIFNVTLVVVVVDGGGDTSEMNSRLSIGAATKSFSEIHTQSWHKNKSNNNNNN